MERVGHFLVGKHQAHDVDEGAARKAVDDWIGHLVPRCLCVKRRLVNYRRQNGLSASRSASWRVRPMSLRRRPSPASSCSALLWLLRTNHAATLLSGLLKIACVSGRMLSPADRPTLRIDRSASWVGMWWHSGSAIARYERWQWSTQIEPGNGCPQSIVSLPCQSFPHEVGRCFAAFHR